VTNVVEPDGPHIIQLRKVARIHTQYLMLDAVPRQQWLSEGASVLVTCTVPVLL
jgi:hypothetical protein